MIADELNAMVDRYPDRTFVNARVRLDRDEWVAFMEFMGERDDWLIVGSLSDGYHQQMCRRVVEFDNCSVNMNFTAESFALAKMFIGEAIKPTTRYSLTEEGWPKFEPC